MQSHLQQRQDSQPNGGGHLVVEVMSSHAKQKTIFWKCMYMYTFWSSES